MPDHPAIFKGHHVEKDYETYASLPKFLEKFGDEKMDFKQEYGQAGAFGAHFPSFYQGQQKIRDAVEKWDNVPLNAATFGCEDIMCQKLYSHLGTPWLFEAKEFDSTNFLIGGPNVGLPFHKHQKTWQGLLAGRKLWYLVPPGTFTDELAARTGPYLHPTRGWSKLVDGLPLGKRPLRCVQHPGDIIYFPDDWWHATQNLDKFQLAWGRKPLNKHVSNIKSAELIAISEYFPRIAERFPFPSDLTMHFESYKQECNDAKVSASAATKVNEPIQQLVTSAKETRNQAGNDGLCRNMAFALCKLAGISLQTCPNTTDQGWVHKWRAMALDLDPNVQQLECQDTHPIYHYHFSSL